MSKDNGADCGSTIDVNVLSDSRLRHGKDLHHAPQDQVLKRFLDGPLERACTEDPVVLVDVGASGGLSPIWEPAAPYLQVIAFDPDPRAAEGSTRPGWSYIRSALAATPGRARLNLTRKQQCSSMLLPNDDLLASFPERDRYDVVDTVELDVDTMDRQLTAAGVTDIDFIKLDTQGTEMSLLLGAEAAIAKAFGIEAEVEFAELYRGQALFADLDSLLRARGFQLMELNPCYWKRASGAHLGAAPGQIVFADGVYLRTISAALAMVEKAPTEQARRHKLCRAVAISVLYGHVDYAVDLVSAARGILDDDEADGILSWLTTHGSASMRLPNFRGRWRLWRFAERAASVLKPPSWSDYSPLRRRA